MIEDTAPLEPFEVDPDTPRESDRIEKKLFIGRELDGLSCSLSIEEIAEMPQVWPLTCHWRRVGKLN